MIAEKLRYHLLIAEDSEKDLTFLRNAVKQACAGTLWLDITECAAAGSARKTIRTVLCPFVSVDKRMPEEAGGVLIDDLGDGLRELAVRLNPLSTVGMFTAFPEFRSSYKAGVDGSKYFEKRAGMTAGEYAKLIVSDIRSFEGVQAWQKAAVTLPPVLAAYAKDIAAGDDTDAGLLKRSTYAISLWETGLRVVALVELAALAFLEPAALKDVPIPRGRLDNEPIIALIERLTPLLQSTLEQSGHLVQARELGRFFSNRIFLSTLRTLQQVRNVSIHSGPVIVRDSFLENLPPFVTFLLGMSFWALHPIVADLKVVPWGVSNGLTGKRLEGAWNLTPTRTWTWDSRSNMQINPAHVYQVFGEPETDDKALIIPLYPLVRFTHAADGHSLWLAQDPTKDTYVNPSNGAIQRFDDGALAAWWERYCRRGAGAATPSLLPAEKHEVSQNESEQAGNTSSTKSPADAPARTIAQFYIPVDKIPAAERDESYQAHFDGESKSKDVLAFLQKTKALVLSDLAYVSIGGGDGSEISYALRNSAIRRGILVEFSDYGAATARTRSESLKADGKELVVLQGDAMQRIQDCGDILSRWRQERQARGVILSLQSVLHELPSRSPQYDPNILLANIFEPFRQRIFYSREPARPKEWPPIVHIRLKRMTGRELEGFSRHVNDVLGFRDRIAMLADDFVQMSDQLAVELLFKLLYCRDPDQYRYEMQERLTAFEPDTFCKILRNYIDPAENVEHEYCLTETFRSLYRLWGVEARTPTNDKLGLPKPFVRITAIQAGA